MSEMMSRRRRRTGLLIDARDGPKVCIRSHSPSSASDLSRVSISSRNATTANVLSGSRAFYHAIDLPYTAPKLGSRRQPSPSIPCLHILSGI
jgi:hypothetical protein